MSPFPHIRSRSKHVSLRLSHCWHDSYRTHGRGRLFFCSQSIFQLERTVSYQSYSVQFLYFLQNFSPPWKLFLERSDFFTALLDSRLMSSSLCLTVCTDEIKPTSCHWWGHTVFTERSQGNDPGAWLDTLRRPEMFFT